MWELSSFSDADELVAAVAKLWLDEIAVAQRGAKVHCVALSGGRIAGNFCSAIVAEANKRHMSLDNVHFFWADERCVPPDNKESNYRIARELLFEPLKVAMDQIHRIRGEDAPDNGARKAADEIKQFTPTGPDGQPVLDIIFLGLGEDGHTASLFPGEPESVSADPAVYRAVSNSPKPPPHRVTLGYQAIAAARQVWMLASGAGKEGAIRASLSTTGKTPFARVLRLRNKTRVFTDIHAR